MFSLVQRKFSLIKFKDVLQKHHVEYEDFIVFHWDFLLYLMEMSLVKCQL